MSTCGIEYAHIYSDEKFGNEHIQSIQSLKEQELRLQNEQLITRRVILLDDYSPGPSAVFDIQEFLNELKENQATPDVIVSESALTPYCDKILSWLKNNKSQRSLLRYVDSRQKYPCSLFVAAWYMLRLGVFDEPSLATLYGCSRKLRTDQILTIVANRFIEAENTALEIIKATNFASIAGNIEHRFFNSDLDFGVSPTKTNSVPAPKHQQILCSSKKEPVQTLQRFFSAPLILRQPFVCRSDSF